MTIRAVVFGLALGALLITATVFAEGYWAHHIAVRTNLAYGDDPAQRLDAYLRGDAKGEPAWFSLKKNQPTLVWIHGGGWLGGDKGSQLPWMVNYLERGWSAISLNYRQGPGTAPAAVDDVMCAYKWLIEQADVMGLDPANMVVSGASAGGHLALAVGVLNTSSNHPCKVDIPPKAVVNWFGITDIEAVDDYLNRHRTDTNYARDWIGSKEGVQQISDSYSPLLLISDDTLPIITIHGTSDTVVPFEQAEALHQALTTRNQLIDLTGGNHGGFTDAQFQSAYSAIFNFLSGI